MNEFLLSWGIGIGLAAACWTYLTVSDRRIRASVAREGRVRQAIHWARQTTHLSHPDTCPREVLERLTEPLVPADRADILPLLSFQRCALA